MQVVTSQFVRYEDLGAHPCDTDEIVRAQSARLFYFRSKRNAWNSTWSKRFPRERAFCLTFEEAQERVEGLRVQGSSFRIVVLPTCVFIGHRFALAITEINTTEPLKTALAEDFRAAKLGRLAMALASYRANTVQELVTTVDTVFDMDAEITAYRSRPRGSTSWLNWIEEDDARVTPRYVNDLVSQYQAWIASGRQGGL